MNLQPLFVASIFQSILMDELRIHSIQIQPIRIHCIQICLH